MPGVIVAGTDESVRLVETEDVRLRDLQELVDGYIESVSLSPQFLTLTDEKQPRLIMLVNEEGKMRGLAYNAIATQIFGGEGDCIVGDAVIAGTDGEDIVPLPDGLAQEIMDAIAEY